MTWNINGLRACLRRRFNGKLINLLNFLDAGTPARSSLSPAVLQQSLLTAESTVLHCHSDPPHDLVTAYRRDKLLLCEWRITSRCICHAPKARMPVPYQLQMLRRHYLPSGDKDSHCSRGARPCLCRWLVSFPSLGHPSLGLL